MKHNEITAESLALAKQALAKENASFIDEKNELSKAWNQSGSATTGITAYDLEGPAKLLYPVLTPLRNKIPRVSGKGGIQANWKAVTGVNTRKLGVGVSEGNRAPTLSSAVQDYNAVYKSIGVDDNATWEAAYAAEGFQDLRALVAMGMLRALMIGEELYILGANGSLPLTQVGVVTKSLVDSGGLLPDSITYAIQVVALTLEALNASSMTFGLPLTGNVTLADGTVESRNGGTSQPSASVTQATGTGGAGNVHSIQISWPVVNGAVAYGVYVGVSGQAVTLNQIVTINSALIIAPSANGAQNITALPNVDSSVNSLAFDGYLTQIYKPGSNAYVHVMPTGTPGTGTPLTSDGNGGIVEIENALQAFWDTYRISPTEIIVGSQERKNISAKIVEGQANNTQRFVFSVEQDKISGGVIVKNYYNRFGITDEAQSIPIRLHPNMPNGTIMFNTEILPYPLSGVTNVTQIRCRRDYHQVDWVERSRKYEMGIYADEVLQIYAPFSLGVITNVANG